MKYTEKINNIKLSLFTNNYRGVVCYKYLIKKGLKINYIILTKKNIDTKVINFFIKKKINYIMISDLNNKKIKKILNETELGLVCGFPHIFKEFQFDIPKYGLINLHAGKLPEYRGGSPLVWQILNNEKYFGISAIKVNKGIDTGNIIYEKKFRLLKKYTIEDLKILSNNFFPRILYKSIFKIVLKKKLKKQNNRKANYFKQRNTEDSLFEPTKIKFLDLNLLLRATSNTYQRPYFFSKNKKIVIKKIKIVKKKNKINTLENFIKLKDKIIKIN